MSKKKPPPSKSPPTRGARRKQAAAGGAADAAGRKIVLVVNKAPAGKEGQTQPHRAAPRSAALGGLRWPAIPSGGLLQVMALQVQLAQSQWWSAERLLAHQLIQIQSLINHAQRTVPFYRDRLGAVAGLPAGKLTMDVLRDVPILARADIQEAGDAIATRALPKEHGRMFAVRTSGSTGRPLEVRGTEVTSQFYRALGLRFHIWHRRDFAGKSVTIKSMKPGQRSKRFDAWAPVPATGPAVTYNHALPASELLDILVKEDPDYLQVHPPTLKEMIRISRDTGKRPRRLREVRTMGEALEPELREMCRDDWGVPAAEGYSCQEASIMALQCPDHPHLHVQSEHCLIEILDDDGRPCEPGELGRIVVTSLNNFATPLIRYEIGDMAEVGAPCPCGRGLPVLNRIAGRVRNLAVLPSGEKVMPVLATEPILNELPIRQFQLVQKTVHDIEASLAVRRPLSGDEEARFADFFNRALGHRFRYRFVYVDEIPRLPSGKYEVFRCEVDG